MKTLTLLEAKLLPVGFEYPSQFKRTLELGLIDFEPWYFVDGSVLQKLAVGLSQRYSGRKLVPFARRQDNDDVACWDADHMPNVYVIHDFASPGYEERYVYASFYDWLKVVVDDYIEFDT